MSDRIRSGKLNTKSVALIMFYGTCLFFIAISLSANSAETKKHNSLTVLASTSISDAITEIARLYSAQQGITVSVTFQPPEVLADSIISGETADLFIAESQERFTDLQQRGILDFNSVSEIAHNKLVLAVSKNSSLDKKLPPDATLENALSLLRNLTLLIVGDPSSAVIGAYSKTALENLGLWQEFESATIKTEDSKIALNLISKSQGAGIIYYTDAYANPAIRIVAEFPEDKESIDKISYRAAVVAGDNMEFARKFLEYLKSPPAIQVLKNYGFSGA